METNRYIGRKVLLGLGLYAATVLGIGKLAGHFAKTEPKAEYIMDVRDDTDPKKVEIWIRDEEGIQYCLDNDFLLNNGFERISTRRWEDITLIDKEKGWPGFSELEVICNKARRSLEKK